MNPEREISQLHEPSGLTDASHSPPQTSDPAISELLRAYERQAGMLSAIAGLRSLKPNANTVDCAASISPETFLSRYYAANEPLLLKGFLHNWPAFQKWSPRYFAEHFGAVELDVYEDGLCQPMPISKLVDRIERDPDSGQPYLVAQNHEIRRPQLAALLQDIQFDPGFFDLHDTQSVIGLWVGPGNTVTQLHYDRKNVLLAQVFGRKRVKLISPLATTCIHSHQGGSSVIDPDDPDFDRFPLFKNVAVSVVEVQAGDALFLPLGWWHHVRSLSPSISLSLSNFVWPNSFPALKL